MPELAELKGVNLPSAALRILRPNWDSAQPALVPSNEGAARAATWTALSESLSKLPGQIVGGIEKRKKDKEKDADRASKLKDDELNRQYKQAQIDFMGQRGEALLGGVSSRGSGGSGGGINEDWQNVLQEGFNNRQKPTPTEDPNEDPYNLGDGRRPLLEELKTRKESAFPQTGLFDETHDPSMTLGENQIPKSQTNLDPRSGELSDISIPSLMAPRNPNPKEETPYYTKDEPSNGRVKYYHSIDGSPAFDFVRTARGVTQTKLTPPASQDNAEPEDAYLAKKGIDASGMSKKEKISAVSGSKEKASSDSRSIASFMKVAYADGVPMSDLIDPETHKITLNQIASAIGKNQTENGTLSAPIRKEIDTMSAAAQRNPNIRQAGLVNGYASEAQAAYDGSKEHQSSAMDMALVESYFKTLNPTVGVSGEAIAQSKDFTPFISRVIGEAKWNQVTGGGLLDQKTRDDIINSVHAAHDAKMQIVRTIAAGSANTLNEKKLGKNVDPGLIERRILRDSMVPEADAPATPGGAPAGAPGSSSDNRLEIKSDAEYEAAPSRAWLRSVDKKGVVHFGRKP